MTDSVETPKQILVVDDEKHIVTYLVTLLRDNGYETLSASSVDEALDAVRRDKPDLVILDLMMPKKTGTEFCRRLAREKELADTPIIVVSALAGRDLAVPKPAAVFAKPIHPDEFIAAVEKALA